MSQRRKFTRDEIVRIYEMWKKGYTYTEISKAVGRAFSSVVYVINKLQANKPNSRVVQLFKKAQKAPKYCKISKDDVKFVYENYGKMSYKEMADKLGHPYHRIAYIVKRLRNAGVLDKKVPKQQGIKYAIREFLATME